MGATSGAEASQLAAATPTLHVSLDFEDCTRGTGGTSPANNPIYTPAGFNLSTNGSTAITSCLGPLASPASPVETPYAGSRSSFASVVRDCCGPDQPGNNNFRAELSSGLAITTRNTMCYALAVRIPSTTTYNKQVIIFQNHQDGQVDAWYQKQFEADGNTDWLSANAPVPFAFFVEGSPLYWGFFTKWQEDLYVLPSQPNRRSDRYSPISIGSDALGNSRAAVANALGSLVKDAWYWWRVKITWDERGKTLKAGTAGQTGALQIWRKGPADAAPALVVDRQHYAIGVGPIHNDASGNFSSSINISNRYNLKYGIYAYSGELIQPVGQRTFQILHDNIQIASGPDCETLLTP